MFTTAADRQTAVTVHVVQGVRALAVDDVSLGTFNLEGLPPAPRGLPKIEVTFDIDASGLLEVLAREQVTGQSRSRRITGSTHLAREERERMIHEAEKWADDDRKRRDEVERLNAADALAYQTERFLADHGSKLDGTLRGTLEQALTDLRGPLSKRDASNLIEVTRKLEASLDQAGRAIYASVPPESEVKRAAQGDGAAGEKVVDARFRRGA